MSTPNPVAVTVFGFSIYWYGILITAAVLLGILLSMHRAKRYDLDKDSIVDYALFVIPAAIIGARLYYVLFNLQLFSGDFLAIFDLRRGGLAFYGGLIGAVIAGVAVSRYKKIKIATILDVAIPAVALGQAIGRWGNYFNQEAYGEAVLNPSLQFFPYAVYIDNVRGWHMAAFFYESMACLLLFLFLLWMTGRVKQRGDLTLWYGVVYGIERAIVEGIRLDSLYLGQIRISQALSIVIALGCAALLIYRAISRRRVVVEIDPTLEFNISARGEEPSGTANIVDNDGDMDEADPQESSQKPVIETEEQAQEEEKP